MKDFIIKYDEERKQYYLYNAEDDVYLEPPFKITKEPAYFNYRRAAQNVLNNYIQENSEYEVKDQLNIDGYKFTLFSLGEKPLWRGYKDQADRCDEILEVKDYNGKRMRFQIWSFMNDLTIELSEYPEFSFHIFEVGERKFAVLNTVLRGITDILSRNGLLKTSSEKNRDMQEFLYGKDVVDVKDNLKNIGM